MQETQEKFIDLGADDNGSGYGDMAAKQERFNRDINKVPFKFATKMFDLPAASSGNAEIDEDLISAVQAMDAEMAKDLDHFAELISGKVSQAPVGPELIVEMVWDRQRGAFA